MTDVWNKKLSEITVAQAINVGFAIYGIGRIATITGRVAAKRYIRNAIRKEQENQS